MKASNYIRSYIFVHKLNITKIAQETGISVSQLSPNCKKPLNATEFLQLCCYLHIKPETILSELH
ncbi:MAG: hypothetical protein ACI4C1_03370 [Lachnospiraceae bacterium]